MVSAVCLSGSIKTLYFVNLVFIGPVVIVIVEEWRTNLMSLAILFHFLCTQHVSDINIPIIRSLRLCCWITTLVVLFSVRCVLEIWCGWVWVVPVLQAAWNKTASDIKLVLYSSTKTPSSLYDWAVDTPFRPVTFWAGRQSYSLFNNVSSSAKCDVNVKWEAVL